MALLLSRTGDAFERQWNAGVDLGYASVSLGDEFYGGLGGGLHLGYGLTDAYNLMVEVGGSRHSSSKMSGCEDCDALLAGHGGVGVAYTLDVISWVPYLGLLFGGYRFSGAGMDDPLYKAGFQLALGCDYRPSRHWGVGVQARYHTFVDAPFDAQYLTVFGRFELLWGW